MKNKILILTSKQNYVWTSMQEIVPLIEQQWLGLGTDYSSKLIDCDNLDVSALAKEALLADLIVLSVFNTSIAKAAIIVREKLGIHTPWIVYLHGQATLGMWPYSEWGLSKLFTKSDYFVGTCEGDDSALKLIYPEANFYKSTFSYTPLSPGKTLELTHCAHSFIYVGRISAQKQLHQLIWAFYLYRKNFSFDSDLHLFGGEDNLGSPNMGIKGSGYLTFLKDLVEDLDLEDLVHFHGFINREDIHTTLKDWNHTLVYPSLHSDENFGMSLMRGLCEGSTGICTEWGGFKEHLIEFPNSLLGLPVREGQKKGPYLDVDDLVMAMQKSQSLKAVQEVPSRYLENTETEKLIELAQRILNNDNLPTPLISSPLLEIIIAQRKVLADPSGQRIFVSYDDPISHKFFRAYGMKKLNPKRQSVASLAPWIRQENSIFLCQEPHKGPAEFSSEDELTEAGHTSSL